MQRCQCRRDLVGVVRKVVDDGDAVRLADDLEPAANSGKRFKRFGRDAEIDAGGARRSEGGQSIGDVVRTRNAQTDRRRGVGLFDFE